MGLRRFSSSVISHDQSVVEEPLSVHPEALQAALASTDPYVRHEAIRQAGCAPQAISVLLEHLAQETNAQVQEALMLALEHSNDARVVVQMFALLASEDAWLRNRAQEVLLRFPAQVMAQVRDMYAASSSDEKIFLMNLMKDLAHPDVGAWVLEVLATEAHVNVVATALETIAEIGDAACLPLLEVLRQRFESDPFIAFTLDVVRERILTS